MTSTGPAPPRVALIGANGHGRSHRRTLAALQAAGAITLVALADLAPVRDEPDAPVPAEARVFTDYRQLLTAVAPEVVVICTPPHTHLEIAAAAAEAGADLLLEKPPLLSAAEHHALTSTLARTGRACQVGFQALGSAALAHLREAIQRAELGAVTAISAVGAWQRPDSYYQRAAWAGRRSIGGRPVLDGALANPFAHALMHCLVLAEVATGAPVWPQAIALERYRARPIEVDDTAVLRVHLAGGLPVVVAVTLCGDEHIAGQVLVHGASGTAELGYTTDELRLPGGEVRRLPGRAALLPNLLEHRRDPAVPLLAPLHHTLPFTAVIETLLRAPEPLPIDAAFCSAEGAGTRRVVTVPGISALLRRAAIELAPLSTLGAGWATTPWCTKVQPATLMQHTGG